MFPFHPLSQPFPSVLDCYWLHIITDCADNLWFVFIIDFKLFAWCVLFIAHFTLFNFCYHSIFALKSSFVVSNYLLFVRHREFSCMLQIVMSLEGLFRLPTITHLIITMTFGKYLKTHWWVTSWFVIKCFLCTKCLVQYINNQNCSFSATFVINNDVECGQGKHTVNLCWPPSRF